MAEFLLDFDDKKLQRGFVDIEKANVIAVKNTLNTMAFISRKNAIGNIGSDFINRNNFTQRQIQVDKAEGVSISQLVSKTGATDRAGYMALQESGGSRDPKGSAKKLHIPTNIARGGSKTNVIPRTNRINKLKTSSYGRRKRPGTRKARIFLRAAEAKKTGKFLRISSGIYKVTSIGKRRFQAKMVYNTMNKKSRVKPTPWLEPSIQKPIQDGQAIYNSQINKLLKGDII